MPKVKKQALSGGDLLDVDSALLTTKLEKNAHARRANRLGANELRFMRVGYWDIESTNLSPEFGFMLCYSIMDADGALHTRRIDESPGYEAAKWDDRWLARQCRDDLEKYQIIVGWNHINFDLNFLNTVLIRERLEPLDVSSIAMVDLLWASRYRLRLTSNRLENVINYLATEVHKTPLLGKLWKQASTGHRPALDLIVEHNVKDVESLQEVADLLSRFIKLQYRLVK